MGIELMLTKALEDPIRDIHLASASVGRSLHRAERIAAVCGAEDGAAEVRNVPDALNIELDHPSVRIFPRIEQPVVPFATSEDPPAGLRCSIHNPINHCVEAWSVSAARRYPDSFDLRAHSDLS